MLSFFLLPKGVLHRLIFSDQDSFNMEIVKIRNIGWLSGVCSVAEIPRGLGIQDLEVKKAALLRKWLFRLLTEDGIWQTLFRRQCVGSKAYHRFIGNLVIHTFGLDSW
jgi:hypothetical protein